MMNDYIFTEPHASNLTKLRIEAREKRRIPYDCLNAVVDGEKVICKKGNIIGRAQNGAMNLWAALAGRSALVCQNCKDYNADEVTTKIIGKMSGQVVYD